MTRVQVAMAIQNRTRLCLCDGVSMQAYNMTYKLVVWEEITCRWTSYRFPLLWLAHLT